MHHETNIHVSTTNVSKENKTIFSLFLSGFSCLFKKKMGGESAKVRILSEFLPYLDWAPGQRMIKLDMGILWIKSFQIGKKIDDVIVISML